MSLTQYYGEVRPCDMCRPEVNIHGNFCQTCMDRKYLAKCVACDGNTFTEVGVGGSLGSMKSTCLYCGGKGAYPVSKEYYEANYIPPTPEPVVSEEVVKVEKVRATRRGAASEEVRQLQPADVVK